MYVLGIYIKYLANNLNKINYIFIKILDPYRIINKFSNFYVHTLMNLKKHNFYLDKRGEIVIYRHFYFKIVNLFLIFY